MSNIYSFRKKADAPFKPKGKPRGRPRGWRKRSEEDQDVTTIQITRNLREMIESERSRFPKDRITDILFKILLERTQRIKSLEAELLQLKATIAQWRDEHAIIEEGETVY
jgi:hypothetical protein